MKESKFYIAFVIVILLTVIGIVGTAIYQGKVNFHSENNMNISAKELVNKSFNAADFTTPIASINIQTSSADIEVRESSDDNYSVIINGSTAYYANALVDNDSLNVTYDNKACKTICAANVIVTIPSSYSKNIQIVSSNGDIKLDSFDQASLNLTTDNGDIRGNNISNLSITTNNGDIKFGKVNNSIEIHNNCGDVEIDSLNINKNSIINTNVGDIKIRETNDINIVGDASVGKTQINKSNASSDITLDLSTDMGGIEVNK